MPLPAGNNLSWQPTELLLRYCCHSFPKSRTFSGRWVGDIKVLLSLQRGSDLPSMPAQGLGGAEYCQAEERKTSGEGHCFVAFVIAHGQSHTS